MSDIRYTISEMAKLTDTEPHVLRYWEEELELFVPRNEMGHRYYTEKNLQNFKKIKELKKQGFQLRTIREIMRIEEEELQAAATGEYTEDPVLMEVPDEKDEPESKGWKAVSPKVVSVQSKQLKGSQQSQKTVQQNQKGSQQNQKAAQQNQKIAQQNQKASQQNQKVPQQNQKASQQNQKTVKQNQKVSQQNRKPADGATKATQEEQFVQIMERLIHDIELSERKEGRYRRLDAAIRKHQQSRKMVAATEEKGNESNKQRKKKKKQKR